MCRWALIARAGRGRGWISDFKGSRRREISAGFSHLLAAAAAHFARISVAYCYTRPAVWYYMEDACKIGWHFLLTLLLVWTSRILFNITCTGFSKRDLRLPNKACLPAEILGQLICTRLCYSSFQQTTGSKIMFSSSYPS